MAQTTSRDDEAFFESKVRPVLAEHCFSCHGPDKQKGRLRLDSLKGILQGGVAGPAIVAGKPNESLLIQALRQEGELKMPPRQRLPKQKIDDIAHWILKGGVWPGPSPDIRPGPPKSNPDKDRDHWSFRPVKRPAVPNLGNKNPIDLFIGVRLKDKGLTASKPASPRELVRRVTFDLTGLPPTPEEVDDFVKDGSAKAYERLVDRLLASPRYGERWARHWLDVVRFAQSYGYERDEENLNAWRYRDYVIAALNEDKPFDRFVKEHIAGDEMAPVTDAGRTATGFFHLGVWDDEPDDQKQADIDNLDDMLSTTSEAFLGLTVGCARCHDHKFDPIPQEDYYSMLAFLRNIKPMRKGMKQITLKEGGTTLAVQENGPNVPPTHILASGQVARQGKRVEPRFLRVLCDGDERAVPTTIRATPTTSGRRLALAEWIARKDNPLTARVIVNRLWHWHFGRGLAATPSDLGRNGAAPSHPELLDWLAVELMDGDWKLKRIHKLIVLSETYRQSSAVRTDQAAIDPGNVLLWRQNLRRLEAEAIRDAVLATSGKLNLAMGGRGVFPALPREVLETQSRPGAGWKTSSPEEQGRRSVYIFVKRTLGVPLLETFDFASPDKSTATRTTTTIAPQALILLNSSFTDQQATAFAARVRRTSDGVAAQDIERVFALALQRRPTDRERTIAQSYMARVDRSADALAALCKLVLNLNEFVYID